MNDAELLKEQRRMDMLNSNDIAIRKTFYRYHGSRIKDKINTYYEKDKSDFLDAALENKSFILTPQLVLL